jgi:hypothetical protein
MQEREYVVTLHSHGDLDSFYEDMETPGGNLYIPNREVAVFARRLVSRNTHYLLTDDEADQLKNDPRVMSVELSMAEKNIVIAPAWTQVSNFWDKSNSVSASQKNWAILRCTEGAQRASWGSNGIVNVAGTAVMTASGKNVDVVVVDGLINPSHPEFAVNSNGTGGSRVNQYNWYTLTPQVEGGSAGTYTYTPYVDATYPDNDNDGLSDRTVDNDHGCHVAGIFAGNTQGWARDSNIYNISPYASSPSSTYYFIDYIKAWHQSKSVNPITGIKNPTITNHSYGAYARVSVSSIDSVTYQGVTTNGPFTASQLLNNYGIYSTGGTTLTTERNTAFEQDLIDLMAAGVICVGSAANAYSKIANYSASSANDYNNYFSVGTTRYYYMRGSFSAATGMICVGAISASFNDSKYDQSNCGPRIDVYAPGRYIMSSVNSTLGVYSNDARNTAYRLTKKSGTSMASPQVAGVMACLAESWPRIKQADAVTYVQNRAKTNQITTGTTSLSDVTNLQGSNNRYLYAYKERPDTGQVGPKTNAGNRPAAGQVWPRPKIYRYGS